MSHGIVRVGDVAQSPGNWMRIEEGLDSRDLPVGDFDAVAYVLDALISFHVEDRCDMIALDDVPLDFCASNAWQDQSQKT
jgi:hypothetical protein